MTLPEGWFPLAGEVAASLEAELKRELPPLHQLHGHALNAIARRRDADDVLYQAGGDGPVFVVHLTWSVERDPKWPATDRYESLTEFITRYHGDV